MLLLFRGRRGLLAHQGAVVHRNVNVRRLRPPSGGPGRGLGHPDHRALRRVLGLVLIPGAAEKPVGHVHNGAVEGPQAQHQQGQHKDHRRPHPAEHLDKGLSQHAGEHAAAGQGLSALPQGLSQRGVPGQALGDHAVDHAGEHQREHQGAEHPQAHRPAPVKGQDEAGEQQSRRHQPEAVADQALDEAAQGVDKQGLDVKAAEDGEDSQQQADTRPHLPAEGPVGGRGGLLAAAGGAALGFG